MPDEKALEPVRLVINNAREAPGRPKPPPEDGRRRGHDDGGSDALLPEGCPVTPLGVLNDTCFYLDYLRQFRGVVAEKHGRNGLAQLFGRDSHLLKKFWPRQQIRTNKETGEEFVVVTGFKPELAADALMAAASACGVWDPLEKLRGRGAWRGENGELILHCGDTLYVGGDWRRPGVYGRHVYPCYGPIPQPHDDAQRSGDAGPGTELLQILKTWNWRNKEIDALLLLGWIASAMLGGAVKWRPVAWITGGTSTGKSTLQELLENLFDRGLIHAAEASAAGVWQKLGHSSLPVAIDEQEAEEDNRKLQALVKLARLAASGALILRGGADHTSAEFAARSCFLFTSILVPPLLGQDRNRMAILELDELAGEKPPDLSPKKMAELGRRMLRRLVDNWNRWPDTLETYRQALSRAGHSARRADVFGTMLAAADLLLHDGEADHEHAAELAERLEHVLSGDRDDSSRDEERWLDRLATSSLPLDGATTRRLVGDWVGRACENYPEHPDAIEADRILGLYGLKVVRDRNNANTPTHLAVANYHQGLARLFEGSHWAARSGTMGVWVQAARRLPLAERSKSTVYFAGARAKATVFPIDLVWSPNEEERRAAPSAHLRLD